MTLAESAENLFAILWIPGLLLGSFWASRKIYWDYYRWMDTRDEIERREAARGPDD